MIQHSAPQHVTETSTSSASQPKGNHSIRDTNGCQKLTTIKRYLKQRLFHRNSKCFLLKCFIYLRSGEGMRGRSRRGEFSQMLDHCRALATVEKGPGQRQDPQVSTQVSHTTAGVHGCKPPPWSPEDFTHRNWMYKSHWGTWTWNKDISNSRLSTLITK